MKRNVFLGVLAVFFCGVLTVAFSSSVNAATKLTYANFFPPTHIQSQLAESWCREVEDRTGGEVEIKYFPGGTLTKAPQTYDGVVKGIADIGMTCLAYTRGRFPVMAAVDLPMGYSSGVQATEVANAVYNEFKPEELMDTQLMFLHAHGPGLIHTKKKKVEDLEDLKGLKLRGTGTSALVQDALGATPVPKSMGECYQMLQKGVVDGSSHPIEANKGWKLGEVVNYMVANFSTAYTTTFAVFMNEDKWNALSDDAKAAIKEINEEWREKHGKAWDASDMEGLKFFLKQGGQVIGQDEDQAEKWEKAAQPVIRDFIEKSDEKGIDGEKIVDFIQKTLAE